MPQSGLLAHFASVVFRYCGVSSVEAPSITIHSKSSQFWSWRDLCVVFSPAMLLSVTVIMEKNAAFSGALLILF